MKSLEIGGGEYPHFRPNLDIRPMPTVDVVWDIMKGLPFGDGDFDMIYSAFLIEHLPYKNVAQFLSECYRVLSSNGKLLIVTANLEEQMKRMLSKEIWDIKDSPLIFGGQETEHHFHKCGFNPRLMKDLLISAGFRVVCVTPHICHTDMYVEAVK